MSKLWTNIFSEVFLHFCYFFVDISGVGKCLKVVHSATQSVTIGQAMVVCASEQARLVSIKTCDQVRFKCYWFECLVS